MISERGPGRPAVVWLMTATWEGGSSVWHVAAPVLWVWPGSGRGPGGAVDGGCPGSVGCGGRQAGQVPGAAAGAGGRDRGRDSDWRCGYVRVHPAGDQQA